MHNRIQGLRYLMKQKKLDGLLISSPQTIGYITGVFDFSLTEREAIVLVTTNNIYLFTDSRFTGMLIVPPDVTLIEASAQNNAYIAIESLLTDTPVTSLGYEASNLTVSEYKALKKITRNKTRLTVADTICARLRIIKDTAEIKILSYACELTDNAFRYIQPFIREGVTEIELSDRIDSFFKRSNASSAFPSIVAFGPHASVPHHIPTTKQLATTDKYILFDLGARFQNYCGDLSRTLFVGDIPDTIRNQYTAVLTAQEKALAYLTKKIRKASDCDYAARKSLIDQGYPLIPHAVGHGIGINVHEAPSISPASTEKLAPNMVITIEPGLYIPEQGGIRIEDTVLITEHGYTLLTHSPKKMTVIGS